MAHLTYDDILKVCSAAPASPLCLYRPARQLDVGRNMPARQESQARAVVRPLAGRRHPRVNMQRSRLPCAVCEKLISAAEYA